MGKGRHVIWFVALTATVTAGIAPAAGSPAGSSSGGPRQDVQDVSVAAPMQCDNGESFTVNVSARLPRRARAGRAFLLSDVTTDVPRDGAVHLGLSNTVPGTVSTSSGAPSTLQLVAGHQTGQRIEVTVTGATYVIGGSTTPPPDIAIFPGTRVTCTPDAPARLGKIVIGRAGHRPTTPTNVVDVDLAVGFHITPSLLFSGIRTHLTMTVPTELAPGDTFVLSDLQARIFPDLDGAVTANPTIVPAGTDQARATATSVQTVTAEPGQTVDLYLTDAGVILSGSPLGYSLPLGSGHLASIPVVAG